MKECRNDVLYSADESCMPQELCSATSPVHTLNEGTDEYKNKGMDELMKEMDIAGLVSEF
jgi:hypothetical protein